MLGFGCKVIANDSLKSKTLLQKGTICHFEKLLALSDIISIHCPLNPKQNIFLVLLSQK
jgi:D-lactate dehydrogenase